VVVAELYLGANGYDAIRGRAFFARLKSRLASRPEVGAVALAQWAPLSMAHNSQGVSTPDGSNVPVTWGVADDTYLETVGIPLVAGRPFREADANAAPIVIVNQTLAKRLWPGDSPVGHHLRLVGAMREVVGVVRDGKYRSLDEPPTAFAFIPFSQRYSDRMTVYVRARGDETTALSALREEVARLDPDIALEKAGSLTRQLAIYALPQRVAAWSLGAFGLLGLGLAAMGVYGVIAYHVEQKTREVGIRLALGARGRDVMRPVLMPAFVIIVTAAAIALPLAVVIARMASPFLYGIGAADPASMIVASLLFAAVALGASYMPARRAARVDPMASLRTD
jgi:predicted permease